MTEPERLQKEDDYAEAAEATHADFYAAKARKKLERLEKSAVDTKAAFDAAYAAEAAAWDAWVKAKQELEDYPKEQDNE